MEEGEGWDAKSGCIQSMAVKDEKLKPHVDKIYAIDKAKFRRLVVWVTAAERTYSAAAIIAALKAFEPMAKKVSGLWWPYLDKLLDKMEGKLNAGESQADHEKRKQAEAEFARSTFGGRALQKDPRANRHKP